MRILALCLAVVSEAVLACGARADVMPFPNEKYTVMPAAHLVRPPSRALTPRELGPLVPSPRPFLFTTLKEERERTDPPTPLPSSAFTRIVLPQPPLVQMSIEDAAVAVDLSMVSIPTTGASGGHDAAPRTAGETSTAGEDWRDWTDRSEGPDGPQSAARPPPCWVVARVSCRFDLVCLDATHAVSFKGDRVTDFLMAFPRSSTDESAGPSAQAAKLKEFSVRVDGKPQKAEETTHWASQAADGSSVVYTGRLWMSRVAKGKKQRVDVDYTLLIPMQTNGCEFTYILRPVVGWSDMVGHETVVVKARKGLRLEPFGAKQFRPSPRPDGSLLWEITRVAPREDVHVLVSPTHEVGR